MASFMLKNAVIYGEEKTYENGFVVVEEGEISSICHCHEKLTLVKDVIQLPNDWRVVPGFIDLHIHGTNGCDVMDEMSYCLETMCK
ncbi:hypothetical protein BKP45_09860 [Anaerobacillus alkalidiazotrophicus]|uniref:N-acetylglucosamine-6-phosphate deacetylase n=1 Tax=Anaerobacillus alkalidiazotrophicus TaxID=472963 RepID=A0A1S2M6S0_9BACI|nr:hypothetical protein [Anaerobacillus alkalidiazotrophicus]OIJ20354.1 hypothetical protein BKP45_09860 [Anaerobacillus alkalidiazotrophicus]